MARYDRPKAVDAIVVDHGLKPILDASPHVVFGMSMMALAMLTAPAMDTIAKYLGTTGNVSPGIVTLGRFGVQAAILALLLGVLVALGYKQRLWPRRILGNLTRGALMGTASLLFFIAVTYMPVADTIAIFFVEPFILTILSAVFLGETIGWRRGIAVLVGFGGALLVIQPSFQDVGFVTLLPVGSAFIFAFYLLLTRKIAVHDDPLAMQFAAGVGGTLVMVFFIALGGLGAGIGELRPAFPATGFLWALLALVGIIGTVSHLLIVLAFARAPASLLAPFQYIEIVSATTLGLIVFNELPNGTKWLGILIIVSSGIYIFWREAQQSQKRRQTA